jgi:methionyl aminopeptidase
MTTLRTFREMDTMHRACSIVVETLALCAEHVKPGVKTKDLDRVAAENLKKRGALSAFLGYTAGGHRPYPATLCVSVNEEVVHGIPGNRIVNDGDIVGLDLGCIVDGYFGDAARTVACGAVTENARRLMKATEEALHLSIGQAYPGKRLGDMGHAVESHAGAHGYSVAEGLSGHGIGTRLHEAPQVHNHGPAGKRERIVPGMCLAIEPMLNAGMPQTKLMPDDWTIVTKDGSLSAHYELSIAVTEHGPWILSEPYPYARGAHPA